MNTEQTSENIFTYKNKFYLLWHEISPKIWNLAHNEVKRSETLNVWNLEQMEFIFRSELVSDKKRNYYITMIIFLPYTFLILVFQNWFLCRYSIMVVYCMSVMCLCATWTDDYYKLKIILMMINRSGRGIFYDVTHYLPYKNLLIMQNYQKIMFI